MVPTGLRTYLTQWIPSSATQPPLLLTGDPAVTSPLTRSIAQTIACTIHSQEACTLCVSCRQVESGIYPDLMTYTSTTPHTIASVRSIEKQLSSRPLHGTTIIIIEALEQFNTLASQALLKTLEEPPATARFILATNFPGRLPPTIRSRCTRFSLFGPLAVSTNISSVSFDSIDEELSEERLLLIGSYLGTRLKKQGPNPNLRRAFQRLRDFYKIRELKGNKKLASQVLIASLQEIR